METKSADSAGPLEATVRLAALEAENKELRFELAMLRAKVFTNGDRLMTMEGRIFTVEGDGFILDNNVDFDAGLQVSGDFIDDQKRQYAEMIAAALNAPNGEVRGASRLAGEASSAEGATSTVVLEGNGGDGNV